VSITKQSVRAEDLGAPLGTPNLDYFRGMLTLTALRLQIGEKWKSYSYSKHLLAQSILNPLAYGVPNPMLLYIGDLMLFVGISLRHPESRDLSCTIRTTTSECRLRGFLSNFIQLGLETLNSTWAHRVEQRSVRGGISQQVDLAPHEFASNLPLSTSIHWHQLEL
jgi:hypothetical protein